MDKAEARAAHDLMLRRIEMSLKEEDRSNACAWIGVSAEKRLQTLFSLSEYNRARLRERPLQLPDEPLEFPGLPRHR